MGFSTSTCFPAPGRACLRGVLRIGCRDVDHFDALVGEHLLVDVVRGTRGVTLGKRLRAPGITSCNGDELVARRFSQRSGEPIAHPTRPAMPHLTAIRSRPAATWLARRRTAGRRAGAGAWHRLRRSDRGARSRTRSRHVCAPPRTPPPRSASRNAALDDASEGSQQRAQKRVVAGRGNREMEAEVGHGPALAIVLYLAHRREVVQDLGAVAIGRAHRCELRTHRLDGDARLVEVADRLAVGPRLAQVS